MDYFGIFHSSILISYDIEMIKKDEIIEIGKFQKTHALKGELNMISHIDLEYFLQGNPLIVNTDGILVPYFVVSIRPKGSTSYLVKLEGIDSEKQASDFVNKAVYILKKDSDEWLGEDFETPDELVGYKVINTENGLTLGNILYVDDTTANILLIIEREDGKEIYLPFNEELISDINDDVKTISMKIPDGLLDINN